MINGDEAVGAGVTTTGGAETGATVVVVGLGASVGLSVIRTGDLVGGGGGFFVGLGVGFAVGLRVGLMVGLLVGFPVGFAVGVSVGLEVGAMVVGVLVGAIVGLGVLTSSTAV